MMKKINFKHTDDQIRKVIQPIFAYDLAVMYPNMDVLEQKRMIHLMKLEKLSDMFVELDIDDQYELFELLETPRKKSLLKSLESDDLKEFVEDLEPELRPVIIQYLPQIKAKSLELLLKYDEDLAASIMSTDVIALDHELSIKDATLKVVTTSKENDYIDMLFITDDDKRVIGSIDLKDLIMARPTQTLLSIMREDFHFVYEDESIEKAIETVMDYDKNAIPVLDHEDRLLGIVTADDIFDEIIEEAEEDYQKMALLSDHETEFSAIERSKQRLPWLMIAVVLNLLIASFLSIFEATLAEVTALVLFQPLILGMAGNIGTQSLAVTILGLHLDAFDRHKMPKIHIFKETLIGLMNSIIIAISCAIFAYLFLSIIPTGQQSAVSISIIVLVAVFSSMFISALMGVYVPIILDRIKQDPSAASGPIMTTINDVVALVIYFGIATIVFL
jgi:magnesium transporter